MPNALSPPPPADAAAPTLGPPLTLNKNSFRAVVIRVNTAQQLPAALKCVRALSRLRRSQNFPCATRIRAAPNNEKVELDESSACVLLRPTMAFRPTAEVGDGVFESWDDDEQYGVGDRLLHLLQRWQVENVLLVVARSDASLSKRLIGPELFGLVLEAAKLALEQFYLVSMKPIEAAKLELFENPEVAVKAQQPSSQQAPAVCLMASDTVPSWPKTHQPTSDGGGRKSVKQGRINHFMHRHESPRPPRARGNNEIGIIATQLPEHVADAAESRDEPLSPSRGIDWLGISRDEWLQLRAIRVPVKELHYLFMCLVVLLEPPVEEKTAKKATPTAKALESFTPSDFSWLRCREILHQSANWGVRLRELHGSQLAKSQATALRAVFQEPTFTADAFVRISVASVKIFNWLQRLLDEFDENGLGLGLIQDAHPVVASPSPQASPKASPRAQSPKLQPRPPPTTAVSPGNKKREEDLSREFEGLLTLNNPPKSAKIVDRGRLFGNSHSLSGSR